MNARSARNNQRIDPRRTDNAASGLRHQRQPGRGANRTAAARDDGDAIGRVAAALDDDLVGAGEGLHRPGHVKKLRAFERRHDDQPLLWL